MSVRDKIAMWNNMASNSSAPTSQHKPSPSQQPPPTSPPTYVPASSPGSAPWAVESGGIVKPSQMKGGTPWKNPNPSQPPPKNQPKPAPTKGHLPPTSAYIPKPEAIVSTEKPSTPVINTQLNSQSMPEPQSSGGDVPRPSDIRKQLEALALGQQATYKVTQLPKPGKLNISYGGNNTGNISSKAEWTQPISPPIPPKEEHPSQSYTQPESLYVPQQLPQEDEVTHPPPSEPTFQPQPQQTYEEPHVPPHIEQKPDELEPQPAKEDYSWMQRQSEEPQASGNSGNIAPSWQYNDPAPADPNPPEQPQNQPLTTYDPAVQQEPSSTLGNEEGKTEMTAVDRLKNRRKLFESDSDDD